MTENTDPAHRLVRFFQSDWGGMLLLAAGWQVMYMCMGWLFNTKLPLLDHMMRWDSGWYQSIIAHAYVGDGQVAGAPAFYPLFPLVVFLVRCSTFNLIGLNVAGLIVNTMALWFAFVALWRIFHYFTQSRAAKAVGILGFLVFPSAFFLHAFYSEALFVAIGFWTYLMARERHWWACCLLLAVLTGCRLPSFLFVGLCGLEYLRSHDWKLKNAFNHQALWFLLTPIGFILYALYLQIARGDFLAMFHAYSAVSDWTYQVFSANIIGTLFNSAATVFEAIARRQFSYGIAINNALPLLALVAAFVASLMFVLWRRHRDIPLAVFGIVSIIFYSLNSNTISVHRYMLACLTIFCVLPIVWRYRWARFIVPVVLIASFGINLFLYYKFTALAFSG